MSQVFRLQPQQQQQQPRRHAPRALMPLTLLADDVLLDIFRWLDIPDILRLRRTCRRLRHITHYHALWFTLYRTLSARVPSPLAQHTTTIHPLTTLSAPQLEHLTKLLYQLDRNWSSNAPNPQLKRSFAFKDERTFGRDAFGDTSLLPGGRWLVSPLQREGHLAVWDLEDPTLTPTLIPRPRAFYYPAPFEAQAGIATFMPSAGECVAAFAVTVHDAHRPPRTMLEVWRFPLPSSSHPARPEATVSAADLGAEYDVSDLALEGRLLAFRQHQVPSNADTLGARVMDWTSFQNAPQGGTVALWGFVGDRDNQVKMSRLLPNGYFLTATKTSITISDVSHLPSTPLPTTFHPTLPIPRLKCPGVWSIQYSPKSLGRIQSISTTTRHLCTHCLRTSSKRVLANFDVSITTSSALLALHVPAGHAHEDGELSARVTRLARRGWEWDGGEEGCGDAAGPSGHRAVWLEKTADNSTQLIPFSSSDPLPPSLGGWGAEVRRPWQLRVHKHLPTRPQASIVFDEAVGRVCVSNRHKLTVFDFASADTRAWAFLRHLDVAYREYPPLTIPKRGHGAHHHAQQHQQRQDPASIHRALRSVLLSF